MDQILRTGLAARTQFSGTTCTVEQYLGGGGQGEVYRASLDGQAVALKWYFPAQATAEQRAALVTLVKKGPPTEKFLWPLDIASAPRVPGFGYVMPLRDPRYKGIVGLMKRRVEPTFRALATAGLELAHSFLQLHAQGLCYRDISFGNVFFDPQSGDVLICDNDNVTIDGAARGGVLGTPRFMAPEVVRAEALPSSQTDLWSLAVLLFYMLMVHHPLEGKREAAIHALDLPAMNRLYGTQPVFIFDPRDDSNRPVAGLQDNAIIFWRLYPQFLRDLFTRAFTSGIRDPQRGRVRESEWRAAMARLRDAITLCARCGAESFYDADALKAGALPVCWSCAAPIALPPRIRIGRQVIMLNPGTELLPHHVDPQQMYNFSEPVAVTSANGQKSPSLKNLSRAAWSVTTADGKNKSVKPGQSVALANGLKIKFAQSEGEVRV